MGNEERCECVKRLRTRLIDMFDHLNYDTATPVAEELVDLVIEEPVGKDTST